LSHPGGRAVFLDRDGVLIESSVRDGVPHPPATLAEVTVLPGVADSCRRLQAAGYLTVVVTNQPDVARGVTPAVTVASIHAWLRRQLCLDQIYVCPHDDDDRCACRKPAPGLLLAAAADYGIDLRRSVMVGDRWRDIEAGRAAGCRTVHVDRHYLREPVAGADSVVADLPRATDWILATDGILAADGILATDGILAGGDGTEDDGTEGVSATDGYDPTAHADEDLR
jgi:D-glycero-D-manno-heptose 1,7-bisphosphate phosphatase